MVSVNIYSTRGAGWSSLLILSPDIPDAMARRGFKEFRFWTNDVTIDVESAAESGVYDDDMYQLQPAIILL